MTMVMMKTMIMLMMMTMEAQRKQRMLLRHFSFHKEIPIIMMRQADLEISERKDLELISVCN